MQELFVHQLEATNNTRSGVSSRASPSLLVSSSDQSSNFYSTEIEPYFDMDLKDDPIVQYLYRDALKESDWLTGRFWSHLFHRHIFKEDGLVVSSRLPPDRRPDTPRKVDIIVQRFAEGVLSTFILFFGPKYAIDTPSDVKDIEAHAVTYAQQFCDAEGRDQVWVMTCTGPLARLWLFSSITGCIQPYVPNTFDTGDRALYKDFLADNDIYDGLMYMKQDPDPPIKLVGELIKRWHDCNEGSSLRPHVPEDLGDDSNSQHSAE